MGILVDENSRVLVQGITGHQGTFHTISMMQSGTNIVAGVTPGRKGQTVNNVPVYDTIRDAVAETQANTSIIFVPAMSTKKAVLEAIEARLNLIVVITEHVPLHDELFFVNQAIRKGIRIIGPNCPGVITPGATKVGIMPDQVFLPGSVGMISRSGTLTYEIAAALSQNGIGQSTAVGIGGDPVIGLNFIEALAMFEVDPQTKAIVLVGEIGGQSEERAANYIASHVSKPVVAYISGVTAPLGKQMGHAGAIISGTTGTAQEKIRILRDLNIPVAEKPSEIPSFLRKMNFE